MSLDGFQLVRVPALSRDSWDLSAHDSYLVGRGSPETRPDIDLAPDARVSREHARLWFDGGWRIEDLDSRHGTRIRGAPLPPRQAWPIEPGDEFTVGDSRLVLIPPGVASLQSGSLLLEVAPHPCTGYAQITSGRSPLAAVHLHNVSKRPNTVEAFSISIERLGSVDFEPRRLEPGERVKIDLPVFGAAASSLRTQIDRAWCRVGASLNGIGGLIPDTRIACLAANEWSHRPEWRRTLAAFVLPNHPIVERIAARSAGAHGGAGEALRRVYEHLARDWQVEYRSEAPHYETDSQKIRLPHQVLWEESSCVGGGTCLDLAALIAAVLESTGHQPLIAIVELEDTRHALVGCWDVAGPRLEPVLQSADRLLEHATWVDPNGCTRDPAHRREFAPATARARELLVRARLSFALDVGAARQDGVLSLPASAEPQLGGDVVEVIARAHAAARAAGAPLGTVPLLIGLLGRAEGHTQRLLGMSADEADRKARELTGGLRPGADGAPASRHYIEVLTAAGARARSVGLGVVNEANLLSALVNVESQALDAAFQWLGVERGGLRDRLTRLSGTSSGRSSVFEVPSRE